MVQIIYVFDYGGPGNLSGAVLSFNVWDSPRNIFTIKGNLQWIKKIVYFLLEILMINSSFFSLCFRYLCEMYIIHH